MTSNGCMGSSPIGATIRRHNILIIHVNDVFATIDVYLLANNDITTACDK